MKFTSLEIDRSSAIPLWHQIAEILEREIKSHKVPAGSQFATAEELSERFSVNRHTVRQALGSLVDKGLVRIERGFGAFVEEHIIDYSIGKRTRFSANLMKSNVEPGHRLIQITTGAAPDHVAKGLKLRARTNVILLETIGMADERPISVSSNYLPEKRFTGFGDAYQQSLSMTEALSQFGVGDYTRGRTRIHTRLPTPEDARLLEQPRNQPILFVESVDLDEQGIPIVFHEVRFAGDRVQLTVES
jgi:GntR family phosphonate transport system transcriptional regulator